MKTAELKNLIKEAVKEAIQEELKDIHRGLTMTLLDALWMFSVVFQLVPV